MGKTRDLFKKIRDTKGTFHAKMGSIKDRNEAFDKIQHPFMIKKKKKNSPESRNRRIIRSDQSLSRVRLFATP